MDAIAINYSIKPDPEWPGFVQLDEDAFHEAPFHSRLSEFLKHLFEKHRGEAIVIEREYQPSFCQVPCDNTDVFNESYYAAPFDMIHPEEEKEIRLHARILKGLAGSAATPTSAQWESMEILRCVRNTVLDPVLYDGIHAMGDGYDFFFV